MISNSSALSMWPAAIFSVIVFFCSSMIASTRAISFRWIMWPAAICSSNSTISCSGVFFFSPPPPTASSQMAGGIDASWASRSICAAVSMCPAAMLALSASSSTASASVTPGPGLGLVVNRALRAAFSAIFASRATAFSSRTTCCSAKYAERNSAGRSGCSTSTVCSASRSSSWTPATAV